MLTSYLKLALKVLARRKFFTFISLVGISLTLVVLMVATAILDNVFTPRGPERRFDRVLAVHVLTLTGERATRNTPPGYAFLDRTVRDLPGAEQTSLFTQSQPVVMFHEGRKFETHLRRTDGAYWQILDFQFLEGRPYTEEENQGASLVAVITDDMRAKLFGGATAVGRFIEVNGQRFRVIGVVPALPITRYAAFSEIWAPTRTMKTREYEKQLSGDFSAIVLARSRDDFGRMRAEYDARVAAFKPSDPMFHTALAGLDTTFESFSRFVTNNQPGSRGTTLVRAILFLAAVLFIMLPTLNLISINLSRIMERASEIGVRKAFGASARTLVGQFVVENVVLTILGGAIGFVLAVIAIAALNRAAFIPYATFEVNVQVFGYGMLIAALFGIVSGVYPAWRMSRMHPVNALRGGA